MFLSLSSSLAVCCLPSIPRLIDMMRHMQPENAVCETNQITLIIKTINSKLSPMIATIKKVQTFSVVPISAFGNQVK